MTSDLRTFLSDLVATQPDALKRVDVPVDRSFGITAYGAKLDKDRKYPALLFDNVEGATIPCLTNLLATHDRMALALGLEVEDLTNASDRTQGMQPHPPVTVDAAQAPVKEVIWRDDEVDLGKLPIPVHNQLDGGPFLTAAVSLMKDPDSGAINAGIYRHHVYDSRRMGVWFFGSHDGGTIHRRYEERGEPTPIAIAIGHHPGFLMGAVSRVAGIGGEYDAAGAFLGESVEVVKAENSDIMVPARAEIVLEGVIIPGEMVEEGPFAEWPGHYVGGGPKPVIRIDCVTMRADAIFQDIQASGREHRLMGALPRISSIHTRVKQVVPGLQAVNVPVHTRMHCYLSIKKALDSDPTRAAFAAFNTEPENLRMVIVVDDDIDVFDEEEVSWAIGTRFDATKDLQIIPEWNGPGGLLPTNWEYDEQGTRTKKMSSGVIIDATKPAPPVVFPVRAQVPREVVRAVNLDTMLDVATPEQLPWMEAR
ncbi:UbiD family decarboxylase [Nocardioides sp. LHD-245]|uniref:UbiD family decarboxylase n=1 Tax=Nocardioides sp. LHD-245 TaxID=3051387 RepID=UPI0027DF8D36|nr:UbiD family decarboxylase [Nocardioides sp. LHD-245]